MPDIPRGTIFGRRVGKPPKSDAEHFIRCPTCGGWIDCRDAHLFDHEGPLPHPSQGQPQNVWDSDAITGFPAPPAEHGPGTAHVESLRSCHS